MPQRPLRILFTIHTRWHAGLGGPRAPMELAEVFRGWGHEVQKFSYEDAFPERARGPRPTHRMLRPFDWLISNRRFSRPAIDFVRRNAARFDLIDANQTDLPCAKGQLGFEGLLVARSVGLISAYADFERWARRRWPQPLRPREAAHRLLTAPARATALRESRASFRFADLINVSSTSDQATLARDERLAGKIVYQPLGISARYKAQCGQLQKGPAERLRVRRIGFVGTWNSRKGSKDWPAIAALVAAHVPDARFRLLGTSLSVERVRAEFPEALRDRVEVVPFFSAEDLPQLLADCTVGAFPGYLEGFGLGTLELLAAGLPTVAYDAPGTRDILGVLQNPLMVPAGNVTAFADCLSMILVGDSEAYERLSQSALHGAASESFDWEQIAQRTLDIYRRSLLALKR